MDEGRGGGGSRSKHPHGANLSGSTFSCVMPLIDGLIGDVLTSPILGKLGEIIPNSPHASRLRNIVSVLSVIYSVTEYINVVVKEYNVASYIQ